MLKIYKLSEIIQNVGLFWTMDFKYFSSQKQDNLSCDAQNQPWPTRGPRAACGP